LRGSRGRRLRPDTHLLRPLCLHCHQILPRGRPVVYNLPPRKMPGHLHPRRSPAPRSRPSNSRRRPRHKMPARRYLRRRPRLAVPSITTYQRHRGYSKSSLRDLDLRAMNPHPRCHRKRHTPPLHRQGDRSPLLHSILSSSILRSTKGLRQPAFHQARPSHPSHPTTPDGCLRPPRPRHTTPLHQPGSSPHPQSSPSPSPNRPLPRT
jgi:hypothetical protein